MNPTLKPYPEYKDAELPWLNRIPSGWSVRRAKRVFHSIDIRSESGTEELLTVSSKNGVVPRSQQNVTMFKAESYIGHKLCWPGDLVINSLWAWAGGLGFARQHGIISSAYGVYRPEREFADLANYLSYSLRSSLYDWEFRVRSKGIWVSRLQLTDESFLDMPIVLPPSADAKVIARFLDLLNRAIGKLIRAKRRVIELLNEEKQAIISHFVSRGLEPKAPIKSSGIPFLNCVPQHWDVRPFVRCAIERADYRGATPEKVDSGIFLVTAKNVRMGWIDYECSKEYVRPDQYEKIMRRGRPRQGDVLLTTEAPLGHIALVDREDIALAQRIIRFRLDEKLVRPSFALFALTSQYFQDQLAIRATGSTARGIKASKLHQLLVALPTVREQEDIEEYLRNELQPLNDTVSRNQTEIAFILEYRARLTADLVTGTLDIRGVQLPEIEAGDEIEALTETDQQPVEDEADLGGASEADDAAD